MSIGYPDFQRYPSAQSANLLPSYTVTHSPGTGQTGVKAVSSWAAVTLRYVSTAGFGQVSLVWYADSAGATEITRDTWLVSFSTGLFVTVPVKGPFVRLIFNNTGGTNWSVNQSLTGTNNAVPGVRYPVTGNALIDTNVPLLPSATSEEALPWIKGGAAVFAFRPADATGKLTPIVQQFNEAGTETGQVVNMSGATAPFVVSVALPDTPCGLRVINTDGAASHTYTASLITVQS
jgi:hypothetical protein